MLFMNDGKRDRLKQPQFKVKKENAWRLAQFHLYSVVAADFKGTNSWYRARITKKPMVIYDLSGIPLFYDFCIQRGSKYVGYIRTAAHKAIGEGIVSTLITPPGWNLNTAIEKLNNLVKKKYKNIDIKRIRLVCYSYPKLAITYDIQIDGKSEKSLLMDVGDFTEIPYEPGPLKEKLGQIPYSLLDVLTEKDEISKIKVWDNLNSATETLFKEHKSLDPVEIKSIKIADRLEAIKKAILEPKLINPISQKSLDFCCHNGDCHDHECFCLHPQENNVHCARASAQMMLCYWRYCYSQSQIAKAFGVNDNQLTPISAVVPGLNSLTNNCFEAKLHWNVEWNTCKAEIKNQRPFMSCVPGHARVCAGIKEWNIWISNTAQPKFLYIYDPWPPNNGTISWENFNFTNHLCIYTMARKKSDHS